MDSFKNPLMPENKWGELLALGQEKSLQANDYFVRVGEIPTHIAYVFKGLFRYVYINEQGVEFTKGFMLDKSFISSYSAMVLHHPSYFAIEALEPSSYLEIAWFDFQKLLEKDVFWVHLLLQFLERGYMVKEKRERDLLLLDAETRYKNFLSEFPGIDQRVKQGIIASYLGIQPETLSRIRKRITF